MSKIDDLLKDCLLEDGTILLLRDKYIGIRGCMELATKEVLKSVKQLIVPGNQILDEGLEGRLGKLGKFTQIEDSHYVR